MRKDRFLEDYFWRKKKKTRLRIVGQSKAVHKSNDTGGIIIIIILLLVLRRKRTYTKSIKVPSSRSSGACQLKDTVDLVSGFVCVIARPF